MAHVITWAKYLQNQISCFMSIKDYVWELFEVVET